MKSLTEIRRWATLRCAHCGHRFRWSRDARHATSNRDGKVYHGPCLASIQFRREAADRLIVLGITADLAGLDGDAVQGVVEMRADTEEERLVHGRRVWRAFYDLGKLRSTGEEQR